MYNAPHFHYIYSLDELFVAPCISLPPDLPSSNVFLLLSSLHNYVDDIAILLWLAVLII